MDKNSMFQTLARDANERGAFNGAWLYAEGGEIVSKGALGFRDPEGTLPVTEDTVFQLASVSKTFTSAAVLLTVRRGLLSLEDKLGKYFPELPAYADVTVRQLLSHTGGVPDYFDDDDWFTDIWEKEHRVPGNAEIVDFLRETKLGPLFAPGDAFEYSNTGYNLLALLVERLSGEPYEEFLQKNIFEPAGMTSTRSAHIRRDGIPFENFARATVIEDGKYVADVDSEEDGEVVAFDGLNGDDYVFSTVFDMLKWDRALREGKVLTAEEQALAYAPAKLGNGKDNVYDEEEGLSYGLGWATGRDEKLGLVVSHSGGMPGVATWFERFIDADRTLVILTNRDGRDYRAVMSYFNGVEAVARDSPHRGGARAQGSGQDPLAGLLRRVRAQLRQLQAREGLDGGRQALRQGLQRGQGGLRLPPHPRRGRPLRPQGRHGRAQIRRRLRHPRRRRVQKEVKRLPLVGAAALPPHPGSLRSPTFPSRGRH